MREACGVDATASFWKAIPPDGDRLLAEVARDAGFATVEVRQIRSKATLPPVAEYLPAQLSATPWGPLFAGLDDGGKATVVAFATAHLADHTRPDGSVEVTFASHLLVAS
jgi:hypothetical protein